MSPIAGCNDPRRGLEGPRAARTRRVSGNLRADREGCLETGGEVQNPRGSGQARRSHAAARVRTGEPAPDWHRSVAGCAPRGAQLETRRRCERSRGHEPDAAELRGERGHLLANYRRPRGRFLRGGRTAEAVISRRACMPFETIPGTSDQYALLSFDLDGRERTDDPQGVGGLLSKAIIQRVANEQPSHVLLFCHGWKGDVAAARDQYNRWIGAMLRLTDDRQAVKGTFKPVWIGLHWPSQPFGDEELSTESFDIGDGTLSPDEIKAIYLERLGLGDEAAPLIDTILRDHQKNAAATELPDDSRGAYRKLASLAGHSSEGPAGPPDADDAPFDPDVAFDRGNAAAGGANFGEGGFLGGILGPLRQLSYWTMKKRARTIGESGMHQFVSNLMKAAPSTRFHLMGHSFGTIVVSS